MLEASIGHTSRAGLRPINEDFVGAVLPNPQERARKGIIAVIADGVSGGRGRDAAEHCARNILADYYSTSPTQSATQSLETLYRHLNRWVVSQPAFGTDRPAMMTTLTTLVIRGGSYAFAHVGDTRAYLLKKNAAPATPTLQRLTSDHVWNRPEMDHVLTRAIGLDSTLVVDVGMGPIAQGDVLCLVSDGVWSRLSDPDLISILTQTDVQRAANDIVETALRLGSADNASALVLRVDSNDHSEFGDALAETGAMPFLTHRLAVGSTLDGMRIEEILHTARTTQIARVTSNKLGNSAEFVLKTLTPEAAQDAQERVAFAHECWVAARVHARYVAATRTPPQGPSANYLLTDFYAGETLAARLSADHHFAVPDALRIARELARALGALHRRSIIHRDVKPENVHLGTDGQLRLLDLGTAISGFSVHAPASARRAGTPSYLAPELFGNEAEPNPRSDLYAWGVTLYHVLTRKYPYGEIEPFQTPRFGQAIPLSRTRPDVPGWFENIVLRALAPSPKDRFETAEELLLALERGPMSDTPPLRSVPLMSRNRLRAWQLIAVASFLGNFVLLYKLIMR